MQPFRYDISPCAKINSFEPKALEDLATCRASQIGAAMTSCFQDYGIYTSNMYRMLWEAAGRRCSALTKLGIIFIQPVSS